MKKPQWRFIAVHNRAANWRRPIRITTMLYVFNSVRGVSIAWNGSAPARAHNANSTGLANLIRTRSAG